MSTQQKALFLPSKQGEWVIGTTEVPKPGPGQLLVKVEATALNPADWKIQVYGFFLQNFPAILGSDAAGIVEAVDEGVQGFATGDRVLFQGFFINNPQATFQQYALSIADTTAKIPDNISFDEAATIPVGLATAALGLFDQYSEGSAKLFPPWENGGRGKCSGKPIVIFGGASSVGQYVIQLAKLAGFNPIITTASVKNTELLTSLGATHVLDRKLASDALVAQVAAISQASIEVVFDAISLAQTQNAAFDILAPTGQVVIVTPDQIDAARKAAAPRKKVVSVLGNVNAPGRREAGRSLYAKVTELLEEGTIKPNRVEVLRNGLAGIPAGLKRMQNDRVSAVKLVVRPQETP
ncbi:GroES-like protein [Obba rivulosa]|uniref:GroES-like protein n=1 Tax=Obba rivulosa TaxID=1052685 RepID=A0A8E2AX14_9APHY|nr:GroES-like protein [Obba rivulosa]